MRPRHWLSVCQPTSNLQNGQLAWMLLPRTLSVMKHYRQHKNSHMRQAPLRPERWEQGPLMALNRNPPCINMQDTWRREEELEQESRPSAPSAIDKLSTDRTGAHWRPVSVTTSSAIMTWLLIQFRRTLAWYKTISIYRSSRGCSITNILTRHTYSLCGTDKLGRSSIASTLAWIWWRWGICEVDFGS